MERWLKKKKKKKCLCCGLTYTVGFQHCIASPLPGSDFGTGSRNRELDQDPASWVDSCISLVQAAEWLPDATKNTHLPCQGWLWRPGLVNNNLQHCEFNFRHIALGYDESHTPSPQPLFSASA